MDKNWEMGSNIQDAALLPPPPPQSLTGLMPKQALLPFLPAANRKNQTWPQLSELIGAAVSLNVTLVPRLIPARCSPDRRKPCRGEASQTPPCHHTRPEWWAHPGDGGALSGVALSAHTLASQDISQHSGDKENNADANEEATPVGKLQISLGEQ